MFELNNNPAFNVASLTAAINVLPNNYGRLRELNLFPGKGVTTRTIFVEEYNGVLNLLPTKPVGSPGTTGKSGKRKVRSFVIPHIPHDDVILPDEVQGVRKFGTDNQMAGVSDVINDKLQAMRNKHAITLEHLRMGALKGIILDADASTLYNLYTEFGIQQVEVDFALGTSTTNVQGKCFEVVRNIEDNLKGEVMTGVRCLVSQEFFDKLISHALVKDAFKYHVGAVQVLGGDPRKNFSFGGITFEEYRGTATDPDGAARRFIAANYGHAFPEGTLNSFSTSFAPADFNEAVNTIGLEIYAKIEPRDMGRGYDLHSQSNPLPLCFRPKILTQVKSRN